MAVSFRKVKLYEDTIDFGGAQLVDGENSLGSLGDFKTNIDSSLENINSTIETVNSDLGTLNSGFETLTSDLGTLNSGFETLTSGFETLTSDLGILNTKLENLNTLIKNVKETTPTISVNIEDSQMIWADEKPPIAKSIAFDRDTKYNLTTPIGILFDGYDGWYFRNNNVGDKINWYIPLSDGLTFGDIRSLCIELLVLSNKSPTFLSIYTKPKDPSLDNKSSWYNSRINFLVNKSNLIEGAQYSFTYKSSQEVPDTPIMPSHTIFELTEHLQSTRKSDSFSNEDELLSIAIQSDSAAPVGDVEFIINRMSLQTLNGIKRAVFSNLNVEQKYIRSLLNN